MNDKTLRQLAGATLILLLVYQTGSAVTGLASAAAGGVSALVVGAVTFYCVRRANTGLVGRAWLLVPMVLFTLAPLGLKLWGVYSSDAGVMTWAASLLPLLVGFLLPVLLLWLIYAELRRRTVRR